jgi:hypothetical protein
MFKLFWSVCCVLFGAIVSIVLTCMFGSGVTIMAILSFVVVVSVCVIFGGK